MSRIGIDIDNTICNTSEFFGKLALKYDREVLGKNSVINFDKVVPRSEEWTKKELADFINNIFNKESINIPIKEDAVIYINKLKELGHEIVFITNRGGKEDDHTDLIVQEYLKKNNIPYDDVITKAKYKYMYLDGCDYFIDDAIRNCEEALENSNCKAMMIRTNKTKDYNNKKMIIVNNWEEVYNNIVNNR